MLSHLNPKHPLLRNATFGLTCLAAAVASACNHENPSDAARGQLQGNVAQAAGIEKGKHSISSHALIDLRLFNYLQDWPDLKQTDTGEKFEAAKHELLLAMDLPLSDETAKSVELSQLKVEMSVVDQQTLVTGTLNIPAQSGSEKTLAFEIGFRAVDESLDRCPTQDSFKLAGREVRVGDRAACQNIIDSTKPSPVPDENEQRRKELRERLRDLEDGERGLRYA